MSNNNIDITTNFERGKPTNTSLNVIPTEVEELIGEVSSKNEVHVELIGAGPKGRDGKSAYEIWLELGNEGTEEDFLSSLSADSDANYVHKQIVASDRWVIEHGLQKFSSIVIVDSAKSIVFGDIKYVDENTIIVEFVGGFSGEAYLN